MPGLCFEQLELSSLSLAPRSAIIAQPSTGGQCRPSIEIIPLLARPLHALQTDGISPGRELSSCCPCLGPELAPHRFFFGQNRHLWGCSGWQLSDKEFLILNPLGNQSLVKGKYTLNPKRLSSPQTLRIFPPLISFFKFILISKPCACFQSI